MVQADEQCTSGFQAAIAAFGSLVVPASLQSAINSVKQHS
jgi:hypothetical protein